MKITIGCTLLITAMMWGLLAIWISEDKPKVKTAVVGILAGTLLSVMISVGLALINEVI